MSMALSARRPRRFPFPVVILSKLVYLFDMNGKDVIKKLKENGWEEIRVRGSHHLLRKDGVTVPVPVHGARDIGLGLLKKIAKDTGVPLP